MRCDKCNGTGEVAPEPIYTTLYELAKVRRYSGPDYEGKLAIESRDVVFRMPFGKDVVEMGFEAIKKAMNYGG